MVANFLKSEKVELKTRGIYFLSKFVASLEKVAKGDTAEINLRRLVLEENLLHVLSEHVLKSPSI